MHLRQLLSLLTLDGSGKKNFLSKVVLIRKVLHTQTLNFSHTLYRFLHLRSRGPAFISLHLSLCFRQANLSPLTAQSGTTKAATFAPPPGTSPQGDFSPIFKVWLLDPLKPFHQKLYGEYGRGVSRALVLLPRTAPVGGETGPF